MSVLKRNRHIRGASLNRKQEQTAFRGRVPQIKKALVTVLVLAVLLLLGMNSQTLIEEVVNQRIEFVVIEGELLRVTENDVQRAVFDFINRSMVAVDLEQIKSTLENNAWISRAQLRRKWPNTLIVRVVEEVPIARWGNAELLNQEGRVFSPSSQASALNLARLSGPEGSEKQVMEQYQVFNQLLYPLNLRIASLDLNTRGSWTMNLTNEVNMTIGSINSVQRLRRFTRVYEELFARQLPTIERFDLRYEDGIAVQHKTNTPDALASMQL